VRARRAIALVVIGLPVAYLAVTFVQVWQKAHHDGARPAQAIVVLGAAQYDGVPSPTLRVRLDHVVALWDRKLADTVVVTGGKQPGDRVTEASASATYLTAHGIPEGSILRESNGRSTYQSLADASVFLKQRGITRVVLVSDAYHAARVEGIADELGFDASVSPTGTGTAFTVRYAEEAAVVAAARIVGFRRVSGVSTRVREQAPVG
jgi:uncharacterized SAM-binding protein YcdF (DUF218 family)